MKSFFALYGMEELLVDQIDFELEKADGIRKYLEEHKGEYDNYVIIDDSFHNNEDDKDLEKHLVTTYDYMTEEDYIQAVHIIGGRRVFKYDSREHLI